MKNKTVKIDLILIFIGLIFSQIPATEKFENYQYQREISDIHDSWHTIILPADIFPRLKSDLSDLRIISTTPEGSIQEAPYLLNTLSDKTIQEEREFSIIDFSRNAAGYYYFFEIPDKKAINLIQLNFARQNFDRKITLEGSQNQTQWFTLLRDYRILSIQSEHAQYSVTDLKFPSAKFHYLRLTIPGADDLNLLSAKITEDKKKEGRYRLCPLRDFRINHSEKGNVSTIHIRLERVSPVCRVKLRILDQIDFIRPFSLEYLSDSARSSSGWTYLYRPVTSGNLSSFEENVIEFENVMTSGLKIIIENHDNTPLEIDSVMVWGNVQQLTARFSTPGNYFLIYGNASAGKPRYDISKFQDKIPANVTEIFLGQEEPFSGFKASEVKPLFQNKFWLWIIMILIIGILGGFSFKMLRKKEQLPSQ